MSSKSSKLSTRGTTTQEPSAQYSTPAQEPTEPSSFEAKVDVLTAVPASPLTSSYEILNVTIPSVSDSPIWRVADHPLFPPFTSASSPLIVTEGFIRDSLAVNEILTVSPSLANWIPDSTVVNVTAVSVGALPSAPG